MATSMRDLGDCPKEPALLSPPRRPSATQSVSLTKNPARAELGRGTSVKMVLAIMDGPTGLRSYLLSRGSLSENNTDKHQSWVCSPTVVPLSSSAHQLGLLRVIVGIIRHD